MLSSSLHPLPLTTVILRPSFLGPRVKPEDDGGGVRPAQNPPPPYGPELDERSGRRKTRPKLKVRLAAPRCGGFGLSVLRSRARQTTVAPQTFDPVTPRCRIRNARSGWKAALYGQSHSGGPFFRRVGQSCRKPPVPCLPGTTQDAGPIPDGSVCTPGLSMTGQVQNNRAQKGGDKFF